ncbi:unnamed protein product [Rhizophagus irregularis]|nr:unnamed protein product [Rhizophagus irregularis]
MVTKLNFYSTLRIEVVSCAVRIKDFRIIIDNNAPELIDRIIVSQEDNSILDIKSEKKVDGGDILKSKTFNDKEDYDEDLINNDIINNNVEENDDNSAKEVYVGETLKSFVVTYNEVGNSIIGWSINIEKDGRQKPVTYFNFNDSNYNIHNIYPNSLVLYKEYLILLYRDKNDDYIARINLSDDKDLVKIKCERKFSTIERNSVGLLPNGDIILVSLNDESKDYKIYKYNNQLTNQMYDIIIPESTEERINVNCFVYQTKLFLFDEHRMTQWDLNGNDITFDKQYILDDNIHDPSKFDMVIVINKNQTLLALNISPDIIDIFSIETGMQISRYEGKNQLPIEFIILKDGSEGLIISTHSDKEKLLYKFLDPFIPSDAIDITNVINDSKNIIITKSKRKFSIIEDNVCITDITDELQDILNNKIKSPLPSPDFIPMFEEVEKYRDDVNKYGKHGKNFLSIMNDPIQFSKFYLKMLETASAGKTETPGKKYFFVAKSILDKIIQHDSTNYSISALLPSIDLNLFDLGDYNDSKLARKYISITSLILDPTSSSVKNSTSPYKAFSKDIYIRKSSTNNFLNSSITLFSSLYKDMKDLRIPEETASIRFIVPFSPICEYKNGEEGREDNFWNNFLHGPEDSLLFCNIDTGNFYKWWNFVAIVDFKWKIVKKIYYLIWLFYTLFFLFFILATTKSNLERTNDFNYTGVIVPSDIYYIITCLFGIIHLFFEVRHCLWEPKVYFNDPWNYFDLGAYSLPILTSVYYFILEYGDMKSTYMIDNEKSTSNYDIIKGIIAISNLLLYFKLLLFLRVFKSFGIYFAIIIGIPKKVFPFLVVLLFVFLGFAHAFFTLLRATDPSSDSSSTSNPSPTSNPSSTLNSTPTSNSSSSDDNKDKFNEFGSSLLTIFYILIGSTDSVTSQKPILVAILSVLVTFILIVYLNNLFIGLLNFAMEDYNKPEQFLLQKAKIIMEIELFYMTYNQRRKLPNPNWM